MSPCNLRWFCTSLSNHNGSQSITLESLLQIPVEMRKIPFILIFQAISIYVDYCRAECKTASSLEHGQLSLQKTEKINPKCLNSVVFEDKVSGAKCCLGRSGVGKDPITCEDWRPGTITEGVDSKAGKQYRAVVKLIIIVTQSLNSLEGPYQLLRCKYP